MAEGQGGRGEGGLMRGLKLIMGHRTTDRHGDSMTESAQWGM